MTKMGDDTPSRNQIHSNPNFDASVMEGSSKFFDDDDRPKRTGNVMTASAHIITAVIGSGVLSLTWAIAQLGWIVGPAVMVMFSLVTYYTSCLLVACYRDPVTGKRNSTYSAAVKNHLGGLRYKVLGIVQRVNLYGVAIGYTITACESMVAIQKNDCFHKNNGGDKACKVNSNPYMIAFGIVQILLSQIPNFDKLWWLSTVAAIMSFTYSGIGLALGIVKVAESGTVKGSLTGVSIGVHVTQTEKIWRIFQALGDVAFAYSFAIVLIEIEDTVKSPPTEAKTMKKASKISLAVTSVFYILCGCFGYAGFGDLASGNLLTGSRFFKPYWVIDIANVAIVIHLVGAYQVFSQPFFAFVEKKAAQLYPDSHFITKDIDIPIPCFNPFKLNVFRLVWRTFFVITTTVLSMIFPFFNGVVGFLGALGYWPLTIYFPVEMYIAQKKMPKWSTRWVCLQILSLSVLIIALLAAVGSVAGVIEGLKDYKPFTTSS